MAFAAICILADLAFTYGIIFRTPTSDIGRINHLYHEHGDEIPIFGSSKAHGNYSPDAMGLNAFNYGFDGISYEVTDVLLQIELAKSKTTPIIIELQHNDLAADLGDQSRCVPLMFDARIRQLLKRFHAMEWRYYLPGIRYFGYYDWYLKDYMSERMQLTHNITKGYKSELHQLPFSQARLDDYVSKRLQITSGYFPNEDQNRRLIGHITEHPERLFFLVYSPYHPSYFAHFQNGEQLKLFDEKLKALPNVVLIDWSQMHFPDEFFLDTLHLRHEAAMEFSRKMGDKIREVLRERSGEATVEKSKGK